MSEFRSYTPPNMKDFDKKTQLAVENFRKSKEIKYDNSKYMTSIIQEIEEQRNSFHKFMKGSIKFSNNLEDYSTDVSFFTNSYKNDNYSNEEYLKLSNDLLIKSKKDVTLIKELKNIIVKVIDSNDMGKILEDIKNNDPTNIGIKDKLTKINNDLQKYKEEIKKCPDLIDSDYLSKIMEETNKKNEYNKYSQIAFFTGMVLLIAISSPAAGPALATTAAAESIVSALGVTGFTSTGLGLLGRIGVDKKEESIKDLKKKLNIEVDELIEKINLYADNLWPIIIGIGAIESFWERQIEGIERLIRDLEVFEKTEKCQNKDAIVHRIEENWKDVKQECQIYSQTMKDLLNKEALNLE